MTEIALAVFTDGRDDLLARTIESAFEHLQAPGFMPRVIYDDTGDQGHTRAVQRRYPEFFVLPRPELARRRGFGGAIAFVWDWLRGWNAAGGVITHVFHLEDDFTFNRPVDITAMATVLDLHPHLAQLALRRQPIHPDEIAAGGVVEQWPDEYVERSLDMVPPSCDSCQRAGANAVCRMTAHWLEQRLFFTTNPSLYRADVFERGWPDVAGSEQVFTSQLLTDPDVRFGYWGARESGEWVHHIGVERVGTGY